MSFITLIMGAILVGVLLVAEMTNMLMTMEMVMMMLFFAPIFWYKKRDMKVIATYLFSMTLMVVARYISANYVIENSPVVSYPITIKTLQIRQFTGLASITVWFIWYALVFISTLVNAYAIIRKCKTSDDVFSRKFLPETNFYASTSAIFIVNLIGSIFIYDLKDVLARMICNIIIVFITMMIYSAVIKRFEIERLKEMKAALEKDADEFSKCTVYDIKSGEKISVEYSDKDK